MEVFIIYLFESLVDFTDPTRPQFGGPLGPGSGS